MSKAILKILFLCTFSNALFGQNDSIKVAAIDAYVSQLSSSQLKGDAFNLIIDSIQVEVIKYGNTIITKGFFKESKTTLTTTFYLKEERIILAKVIEPGKRKGFEKMYKYCVFYFDNNKVIFERCRSTRQLGVAIRVDGDKANVYGYNESLTFDFLKIYIANLFNRL